MSKVIFMLIISTVTALRLNDEISLIDALNLDCYREGKDCLVVDSNCTKTACLGGTNCEGKNMYIYVIPTSDDSEKSFEERAKKKLNMGNPFYLINGDVYRYFENHNEVQWLEKLTTLWFEIDNDGKVDQVLPFRRNSGEQVLAYFMGGGDPQGLEEFIKHYKWIVFDVDAQGFRFADERNDRRFYRNNLMDYGRLKRQLVTEEDNFYPTSRAAYTTVVSPYWAMDVVAAPDTENLDLRRRVARAGLRIVDDRNVFMMGENNNQTYYIPVHRVKISKPYSSVNYSTQRRYRILDIPHPKYLDRKLNALLGSDINRIKRQAVHKKEETRIKAKCIKQGDHEKKCKTRIGEVIIDRYNNCVRIYVAGQEKSCEA